MAQIVTVKNGTTNEIQYPRTVKSALLNDDGTPLNPLTGLELDTKVDKSAIVNDLTTGGATKVLSAEQGKVLGASVSQLQSSISNINVSWDGITGRPTAMPANGGNADTVDGKHASDFLLNKAPTTHDYSSGITDHASLTWGNYNLALQAPSGTGTPMLSFHSQGATAVGLYEKGCKLYTTGSDGRNQKRLLDIDDYNSLFQSVVNGKQAVVNAINGSLGYASGLTTENTHGDYAWWIQNKLQNIESAGNLWYKNGVCYNGFTVELVPQTDPYLLTVNPTYFSLYMNSVYTYPSQLKKPVPTTSIVTIEFSTTLSSYENDVSFGYGGGTTTAKLSSGNVSSAIYNDKRRYISFYVTAGSTILIGMPQNKYNRVNIYSILVKPI